MTLNGVRIVTLYAVIAITVGCTVLDNPQPDPTMVKLDEIDRRLAALERILASGALTDLTVEVDELQREVATLRGRTDALEYDAESTAGRQRDLYVDLDDRVQQLETNARSAPPRPAEPQGAVSGVLPVPGGSDRQNYEAAFELLKEQRYREAGAAFGQFLTSFPDSQLADNAQYWLAESYYVTDQFEEALKQFQVVMSDYPRSRKIPDALLKIGFSNYELARWDSARAALTRVKDDYPDSTAARLAEQRLGRMVDEGH